MKNWKNPFNLFFILSFLLMTQIATGQISDSKTIKKEFSNKKVVALIHSHGSILVQKSPDNKVYITATISAKAKDRASLDIVFDHFEIQTGEAGEKLNLQTAFKVDSWNTNNNTTTIKFKDGTKVKGIKELKLSATLLVPDLRDLKLENKYGNIQVETELTSNLAVQLFSGELSSTGGCKNLELNLKYSKAKLHEAGETKMNLFDSDIAIGDITSAEVNSKYSEIEIGDVVGKLKLTSFDDKWEVGDVTGDLDISDKYSEFEFGSFRNAQATIFDGSLTAASGVDFNLANSKYSKYKIDKIGSMRFELSFDDKVEIKEAATLSAINSKYSDYKVEKLTSEFSIKQSFDDNINLDYVAASFNNIFLEGKYANLEMDIDDAAQFAVEVNLQHGKFNHPKFNIKTQKEVGEKIEMTGNMGGSSSNSSLIIKGFDNTVDWK